MKNETNNIVSEIANIYDLLRSQQDIYLMVNDIKYKFESNGKNEELGLTIKEEPDNLYHKCM